MGFLCLFFLLFFEVLCGETEKEDGRGERGWRFFCARRSERAAAGLNAFEIIRN